MLLALALAACTAPPDTPAAPSETVPAPAPDPDAPRAVIVVLDGARLDETLGEGTSSVTGGPTADLLPELRARLLPAATRVRGARNTGVPITTESHTELFTGLRQDLATFPPAVGTTYRSDVPTLFELVRAQGGLAEDQAVMVVNTVLVEDLASSAWPGLGAAWGATHRFRTDDEGKDLTDPAIVGSLRTWMENHDTRIAFANLHAIDLAGHTGEAEAYAGRVQVVDRHLADLWDWIQATPPYAGHTTLVVVADHGRHREDGADAGDSGHDEPVWAEHGDQCDGCRDLPLVFAGPGIRAGAVVDAPATLADVAHTVAWQLGVPLPMGRGRVLTEIFEAPPDVAGPGPGPLAAAGAHLAVEDGGVWLDGTLLSDARARHAEAPVLAEVDGAVVACWRELVLAERTTWAGRCARDGVDLAFPADVVGARWAPALVAEGGALWAAWIDNPYGYTGVGSARIGLSRWAEGGWSAVPEGGPTPSLPTRVSLARADGGSIVAFAASGEEVRGRDTRRVEVWRVEDASATDEGGDAAWTRLALYEPDAHWARLEAPAVHPSGESVAMIGYGDAGTTVLLGARGEVEKLDATGRVLAHLGARWDGDALVWARLDAAGQVEVCRYEGGAIDVVSVGAATITGLAVTEGGFYAAVGGAVTRFGWP